MSELKFVVNDLGKPGDNAWFTPKEYRLYTRPRSNPNRSFFSSSRSRTPTTHSNQLINSNRRPSIGPVFRWQSKGYEEYKQERDSSPEYVRHSKPQIYSLHDHDHKEYSRPHSRSRFSPQQQDYDEYQYSKSHSRNNIAQAKEYHITTVVNYPNPAYKRSEARDTAAVVTTDKFVTDYRRPISKYVEAAPVVTHITPVVNYTTPVVNYTPVTTYPAYYTTPVIAYTPVVAYTASVVGYTTPVTTYGYQYRLN
jgi:hypothetical protein